MDHLKPFTSKTEERYELVDKEFQKYRSSTIIFLNEKLQLILKII